MKKRNKAGYTAPDASSFAISVFPVARLCACMFVRVCVPPSLIIAAPLTRLFRPRVYVCLCAHMCVWVFRYPSSLLLRSLINFSHTFVCVCACVCACVCLCLRVSPLHFVSIAYVGNKRFREFEKNGLRTDRRTDGRTDGRTDPLIEMRGRI